jgi:hypothetical protein
MKVKELIQTLKELVEAYPESEEYEIVMSKDAEGNGYSPLYETCLAEYVPESSWSGDIVGSDEDDCHLNSLCLWPTN